MEKVIDRIAPSERPGATRGPSETVADPDEATSSRRRTFWTYAGFGLGIVVGFAVTAVQVATSGYQVLPFQLVWNLIWAPFLGIVLGSNLGRGRRIRPREWKRPQLRTRTLMVVVAYVAFLCGMGTSTQRLGDSARRYYQKYVSADSMAKTFREIALKSADDAKQKKEVVEQLHAGKLPDGMLTGQKAFLLSLEADPKATPEFRKYRRGLIVEGWERRATMAERNAVVYREHVAYYEQLAVKYDRARWQPWLPVEPDPPMPPTQ